MNTDNQKIEKIFSLYYKYGNRDYIGEPVSQVEHMTQAAMLAEEDNQSKEIVLAALFHDIGHLLAFENKECQMMGQVGVKNHEKVGADFLKNLGIPEPIPYLVENHVAAKRYLCFKNKEYHDRLSSASKTSLSHQGGPMDQDEASKFEQDKYFDTILMLRHYDEKAKEENIQIKSLDYYKEILKDLLR